MSGEVNAVKVRWWLVGSTAAIGTILTVLPLWLEDRWGWVGVVPSTLTNVGTAFFLAAVLSFAERNFIGTVRTAAVGAAQSTVHAATAELRAENAALAADVRELRAMTEQRINARAAEQDAVIARLGQVASFSNVASALAEAYELRAVHGVDVTVPASVRSDGLRLAFAWGHYEDSDEDRLVIRGILAAESASVELAWDPEVSADAMAATLIHELQAAGHGEAGLELDLGIALSWLSIGLADALRARRGDAGAWHKGQLIEVLNADLVITSAGLVHRERGLLVPAEDFPKRGFFSNDPRAALADVELFPDARPSDLELLDWGAFVRRSRLRLPVAGQQPYAPRSPSWTPGSSMTPPAAR